MANSRKTRGRERTLCNAAATSGAAFAGAVTAGGFPDPIDGADFLAENIPPPDWIIPDFLAKHYQGALFGKSKSRKSFFAIQFGLSVACGVKFLGFPAPERPRRVAYFNLELMPRFLQERLRAQTGALGARPGRGFFQIYNLRGSAGLIRGAFTGEDGKVVHDNELTRQLRDNGIDLAIIDPRYKLMQGEEDENSAAGLRALLDFRTALADVCAALLVGHDPKGDVSTKSLLDRGAGSYTAMADDDCTVILSPNGYADNAVTVETVHRNRAPVVPFAALFDGSTQSFLFDPHIPVDTSRGKTAQSMTPAEKADVRKTKSEALADAVRTFAEGHAPIDAPEYATKYGLESKTTFFSAIAATAAGGALSVNDRREEVKSLIARNVIAETPQLVRHEDGTVKQSKKRLMLVGTPAKVRAYVDSFK